ncbi:MAG: hypothetical protein RL701_6578, partial [Pseudomonadota bacterium]
ATSLLQQARGDVGLALSEAWPALPSVGKRRALRLLFQVRAGGERLAPRDRAVLRSALRDSNSEISESAFKLASERFETDGSLLEELALSATSQGDRAAKVIAHSGAQSAFGSLLEILKAPEASARPALREALATAYGNESGDQHLTKRRSELAPWLEHGPSARPIAERVSLALALAPVAAAHALVSPWLAELSQEAQAFSDQWRLVQAARALPSEAHGDAWLDHTARTAEPWMLRAAALEALAVRSRSLAEPLAEHALSDAYPRVRASAVAILAAQPQAFARLQKTVPEDKWFLVRRVALETLPDTPEARRWFVSALQDGAAVVRASAVAALQRVGDATAWPAIKPLLDNAEQYPEVLAEGVSYARALCVTAAIPSLRGIAVRGLKQDAWSADQDLALSALDALSTLGGEAAVWARDHAKGPNVPKAVQLSAAAAAARTTACTPESMP